MAFDLSRLGLSRGKLPLVVAPMFLVSGVDMVTTCCRSGAVGSFPALNHRTSEGFEEWVETIKSTLAAEPSANPVFGVNLTVHSSNPRLGADLDICVRQKVPLIVTSLGAVPDVVERVHGYGGLVFHDVVNMRHARNAISAGVDGLVLVCAGAGDTAARPTPLPSSRKPAESSMAPSGWQVGSRPAGASRPLSRQGRISPMSARISSRRPKAWRPIGTRK